MKKNNNVLKTIFIILCIGLAIGGYYFYNKSTVQTVPSVEKLIKEKEDNNYEKVEVEEKENEKESYVNEIPNYREQYGNSYIMGKLEIPDLKINSLVTRAMNNEFYLNHNLYNQKDGLGAPFFDYRNTDLANNRQINIYGHNTENSKYYDQLPFINLEAYIDENIFNNYKDVYLSIDEKMMRYRVIAIKIINNNDNEHMKTIFYNDDDYINHTQKLLQNTLYREDDENLTKDDRILVLQVCHYNPKDTYLLVICKEEK